jgi:glycine/D-amino acid oxidase-like deaminating enzyme
MEPAACWNGLRPAIATADGEPGAPLIGRVEAKLWAAFGHYRNGILLAPETARLVASQIHPSAAPAWKGIAGGAAADFD